MWKDFRKRGPEPKVLDAEVITMEIAGNSLDLNCDKTIYRYFSRPLATFIFEPWKPYRLIDSTI